MSKEITAIGAQWIPSANSPMVWLLGQVDARTMLEEFRKWYDRADMVVGHNLRAYDLRTLNAMMVDNGLPRLGPKLVQDTYWDLMKISGISKSQKNLAETLGVKSPKVDMSDPKWRDANRLRSDGIHHACERVAGDVIQNIELRERLLELGYLGPPKMWRP